MMHIPALSPQDINLTTLNAAERLAFAWLGSGKSGLVCESAEGSPRVKYIAVLGEQFYLDSIDGRGLDPELFVRNPGVLKVEMMSQPIPGWRLDKADSALGWVALSNGTIEIVLAPSRRNRESVALLSVENGTITFQDDFHRVWLVEDWALIVEPPDKPPFVAFEKASATQRDPPTADITREHYNHMRSLLPEQ